MPFLTRGAATVLLVGRRKGEAKHAVADRRAPAKREEVREALFEDGRHDEE